MNDELDPLDRRVADAVAAASAFAAAQAWRLHAADVMGERSGGRGVSFRVGTPHRPFPRLACSIGAVAASVVLVLALVVAANRHPTNSTPAGRGAATADLLIGDDGGLGVISPTSGRVLARIVVRLADGSPLGQPEAVAAVPKSSVAFGVWYVGYGGPVLFGFPLSGGKSMLITDAPGGSIGPIALSPSGDELAFVRNGLLVLGAVADDGLGRLSLLTMARLTASLHSSGPWDLSAIAWSPNGAQLMVVVVGRTEVGLLLVNAATLHVSVFDHWTIALGSPLPNTATWSNADMYLGASLNGYRGPGSGCVLMQRDPSQGGEFSFSPSLSTIDALAVDPADGSLAEGLIPAGTRPLIGTDEVSVLTGHHFAEPGLTAVQWVRTGVAKAGDVSH